MSLRHDDQLGPDVGFDYLDDDDESAAGGSVATTFDAVPSGGTPVPIGSTLGVTITANPSVAQSNGSFVVHVMGIGGTTLIGAPTVVGASGWSASGWAYDSPTQRHYAVFTKASVTAADFISLQFTVDSTPGTVRVSTSYDAASLPHTDQATGTGGYTDFDVYAATDELTFAVDDTGNGAPGAPGPLPSYGKCIITLSVYVGGATTQTNLDGVLSFLDDFGTCYLYGPITIVNDGGWTLTPISLGDGAWKLGATRASQAPGYTYIEIAVNPIKASFRTYFEARWESGSSDALPGNLGNNAIAWA